jgi:hypothetical protein
VVSVAGTTNLDGTSNWGVGDWAVFGPTTWQRLEGGTELNAKTLTVENTSIFGGNTTMNALTASQAVATDSGKKLVSVPNTGTGNNVLSNSPTLDAPVLGAATATSINKVTITAPTTAATLTLGDGSTLSIAASKTFTSSNSITLAGIDGKTLTVNRNLTLNGTDGKTLSINNNLAFSGTDGTTMTFPTTSATLARTDAANTFTGHQTIEGVTSTGATGTGKFVFDNAPTITGHPTVEGVTSTGATGTGKFVFSDSPTITGTAVLPSSTSIGTVSSTEIGYLDNVTSNIQTQLDNKVPRTATTGSAVIPSGATGDRDASPANGYFRYNTSLNKFEGRINGAWGSVGGGATGGGSDAIFYENGQTVTTNYTLTTGTNAMSAGPISINSGVTVTVPSGSTWVVV